MTFDEQVNAIKAEYLAAYPKLTEDNFIEAAENVRLLPCDENDEQAWLDAFACHIFDVAFRTGKA